MLLQIQPQHLFCLQCYSSAVQSNKFTAEQLAAPLGRTPHECEHCHCFASSDEDEDEDSEAETPAAWHYKDLLRSAFRRPRVVPASPDPRALSSHVYFPEFLHATFGHPKVLLEGCLPQVYALLRHGMTSWPRPLSSSLVTAPDAGATLYELFEQFALQAVAVAHYPQPTDISNFWKQYGTSRMPMFGYRSDNIEDQRYVHGLEAYRAMLKEQGVWNSSVLVSKEGPLNPHIFSSEQLHAYCQWEARIERFWKANPMDVQSVLLRELTSQAYLWGLQKTFLAEMPVRKQQLIQVHAALLLTWCECTFASHREMPDSIQDCLWSYVPSDRVTWHPSARAPLLELAAQAVVHVCHSEEFTEAHLAALEALEVHGPSHPDVQSLGVRTTQDTTDTMLPDESLRPWIRAMARRAGMYLLPTMTESRLMNFVCQSLRTDAIRQTPVMDDGEVLYKYVQNKLFSVRNTEHTRDYRLWGFEDGWEDPDEEDADWSPEDELDDEDMHDIYEELILAEEA